MSLISFLTPIGLTAGEALVFAIALPVMFITALPIIATASLGLGVVILIYTTVTSAYSWSQDESMKYQGIEANILY